MAKDRKGKDGMRLGTKACVLELKIHNYSHFEMRSFECDNPTILHYPDEPPEDCQECFAIEEKEMIAQELEVKSRKLAAEMMVLAPSSTYTLTSSIAQLSPHVSKEHLINTYVFAERILPGFYTLAKDVNNLHTWFSDKVVKYNQLRLEKAARNNDLEGIESCKKAMDESAAIFQKELDAKLEAAKVDIIRKCEEHMI